MISTAVFSACIAAVGGSILTLIILLGAAPLLVAYLRSAIRNEFEQQCDCLLDDLGDRVRAARTEGEMAGQMRAQLARAAGDPATRTPLRSVQI